MTSTNIWDFHFARQPRFGATPSLHNVDVIEGSLPQLDEDIVVRKLYDFRSAREGEVGAGTTKFGVGPMRSWVDDVREPTQTPFIDTKEARLNAKYSSPRSAEESAR